MQMLKLLSPNKKDIQSNENTIIEVDLSVYYYLKEGVH